MNFTVKRKTTLDQETYSKLFFLEKKNSSRCNAVNVLKHQPKLT